MPLKSLLPDVRTARVGAAALQLLAGLSRELSVTRLDVIELLLRELLEVEERVVRALDGPDQLVELEVHRLAVPVLRVLDEEDHEKGDDRRPRVDGQLPAIAEVEERPRHSPDGDQNKGEPESGRMPGRPRDPPREGRERTLLFHECTLLSCGQSQRSQR